MGHELGWVAHDVLTGGEQVCFQAAGLVPIVFDGPLAAVSVRDNVVMGVTVNGERDILGTWAGDGTEEARFWLQVSSELKNRGVEDVLIAVCDGLKGFLEAINTVWEQTVVQWCNRAPDP